MVTRECLIEVRMFSTEVELSLLCGGARKCASSESVGKVRAQVCLGSMKGGDHMPLNKSLWMCEIARLY